VGCIRWQHDGSEITGDSDQVLARDAVCLLDVPAHKTGTAFAKPAGPLLGQALDAWQAVRPAQPKFTDRRTGELVDLLFAFRARKIFTSYINNTVIPVLCRRAGVPAADLRGNITGHRARSTIASRLYNAKEPMTLFELQAWLGHRSPQPASPGGATTSATATAPTPSSSSASTAWPARSATSTRGKTPARPSFSRPGRTCRRCA
jgi:integrase